MAWTPVRTADGETRWCVGAVAVVSGHSFVRANGGLNMKVGFWGAKASVWVFMDVCRVCRACLCVMGVSVGVNTRVREC